MRIAHDFRVMTESGPVLKWLGTWSPYGNPGHRRKGSSPTSSSGPSSPSSVTSSNTNATPSLLSLREAMEEPLMPTIPPIARLAPPSRPPILGILSRSTMPTASICSPQTAESESILISPIHSPSLQSLPVMPTRSPPIGSSLDTLRRVSLRDSKLPRNRPLSTSAFASDPDNSEQSSWWWFQSGNKENIDGLLDEQDRAATVEEERSHIARKYLSPRNPVVFCHGLLGFDSVTIGPSIAPLEVTHWRGIKEVLEANGTEVLITRVPATSSPVDRAKVLEKKISDVYPGRSVHLIGHSMGGLDCRYLTSKLTRRKFNVLSITTIATPHRGSSFADHFLSTVGQARMSSFLGLLDLLPNGGGDGKAFQSLTIESMRKFNEEVEDVPGVKYFSWGAVYDPGLIDTWKWPHSVILEKEGPNDGLVSIYSARWGTYCGTLEGVNHLDLVGWINTARYKWAEMMGKEIKFRPATFYLNITDMLAREVEGQSSKDLPDDPMGKNGDEGGQKGSENASNNTSSSKYLSQASTRKRLDDRLAAVMKSPIR